MKFSVLFSGSSGNCTYIESGNTRILVDAGLNRKQISLALGKIGVALESINAICITHEHDDHIAALPVLLKSLQVPVFGSYYTLSIIESKLKRKAPTLECNLQAFDPGSDFEIGDIRVHAFSVPHDANDPVGYVFRHDGCKLALASDLGSPMLQIIDNLSGCDALLLEFNHDREMLLNSDRDWALKDRISSNKGHLSNEQACEILSKTLCEKTRWVAPLHLSGECNTHDLARYAFNCFLQDHPQFSPSYVEPSYPTALIEI